MLHITNGDVTAGVLAEAGIAGEILPWRDVLHEGPVPAGLSLERMSETRARFIAIAAGKRGTKRTPTFKFVMRSLPPSGITKK